MHILGAIAEFERVRIVERVRAGLVRPNAQGKPPAGSPTRLSNGPFETLRIVRCRWAPALEPLGHASVAAVTCTPRLETHSAIPVVAA